MTNYEDEYQPSIDDDEEVTFKDGREGLSGGGAMGLLNKAAKFTSSLTYKLKSKTTGDGSTPPTSSAAVTAARAQLQYNDLDPNSAKLLEITTMFVDGSHPLLVPGRVFVKEGVLVKICRKAPKPRYFALCNDILIYGTIVSGDIGKKMVCANQHLLDLKSLVVTPLDETAIKFGFQLGTPTKSFQVFARSAGEKEAWLSTLASRVDKGLSVAVAAVWQPDSATSACMICEFSRFSTFNRRHHCRRCGKVVCGSCSTQRRVLPANLHPVRVCDNCADEGLHTSSDSVAKAHRKQKAQERANSTVVDEYGESSDSDDGEGEEAALQKDAADGSSSFAVNEMPPTSERARGEPTTEETTDDMDKPSITSPGRRRRQFKKLEAQQDPPAPAATVEVATAKDGVTEAESAPAVPSEDGVSGGTSTSNSNSVEPSEQGASDDTPAAAATGGSRRRRQFKK